MKKNAGRFFLLNVLVSLITVSCSGEDKKKVPNSPEPRLQNCRVEEAKKKVGELVDSLARDIGHPRELSAAYLILRNEIASDCRESSEFSSFLEGGR